MARTPRSSAEETAAQDNARLEAEIATLREELAQLARTMGDAASSNKAAFVENIEAGAERLRARGEAAMEGLQDSAEQCMEDARLYVRDNPFTALGIAAGAGLIFGLLLGRR
ncbi:DUF883 family protein [Gemmobacter serpentinus]|uniref:DUF883 family protein n=1 Tax=Gemmobacter serpentinus TaxID=2652247 RepID=UPI0018657AD8|nr:DUF883 family protein [Gemmobacter serpentinus]